MEEGTKLDMVLQMHLQESQRGMISKNKFTLCYDTCEIMLPGMGYLTDVLEQL